MPRFHQTFQRLPIKRQIALLMLSLVTGLAIFISSFASLLIYQTLENQLEDKAHEEASHQLELLQNKLIGLQKDVERIAHLNVQTEAGRALVTEFLSQEESQGLSLTDGSGRIIFQAGRNFANPISPAIQKAIQAAKNQIIYLPETQEIALIVPQQTDNENRGSVIARLDLQRTLAHQFPSPSPIVFQFQYDEQIIFRSPGHDSSYQDRGTLELTLLPTLAIQCLYQIDRTHFFAPLRQALSVLLIISIGMILLGNAVAIYLGQRISQPIISLYHRVIRQGDSFVPGSNQNELYILKEAFEYHDQKLNATIDEMKKARDEAFKSNQTKSEFLANMSHEIRTPMTGVLGMAQLIRFTELNPEQRKYIDAIIDAGDSLTGIINDILDFSKIESGHFQIDFEDFDLRRCLQSTLQIFEIKAKEKGLQLALHIHGELPRKIRGDELRLRQILNNLISNAIKFTSQGQVSVTVSLDQREDGKIALNASVRDTGMGIHQDDLNKLFKSFSQANSSISRKFGGTGLGLAISQALCELMGGNIHVESKLGIGSNFYFTLLFEKAHALDSADPVLHKDYSRNLSILVADDSDVNQIIIKTMFKKLGIKVDLASDGKDAVEKAGHKPYDLIYMDVHMPIMEGPEAARIILEQNRFDPSPKIIALTADMFKDDHAKCYEAGMIDLVTKPIQLSDLRESLLKHGFQARTDQTLTEIAS